MCKSLTDDQQAFIVSHYDDMPTVRLLEAFNDEFGTNYKRSNFYRFTHELGLSKHIQHRYTAEEEQFLKENASKMTRRELTSEFNKRFGACIKEDAIVMRCWQKGYKPRTDGKFKVGSVPWEKTNGGKDAYLKTLPRAPLGKEYYMKGKTYVLTEDGRRPKHRVVWEEHCGELKKGDVIIFADGDTSNFDIKNLRKVNNSIQATLHMNGWVGFAPIVDVGITWCRLKELLEKENYEYLSEDA